MQPFTIKPGEIVSGLGFNFSSKLAEGEVLQLVTVTASPGLTVTTSAVSGTNATATVECTAGQADADLELFYSVTGNAGSVRKATRSILVRTQSD